MWEIDGLFRRHSERVEDDRFLGSHLDKQAGAGSDVRDEAYDLQILPAVVFQFEPDFGARTGRRRLRIGREYLDRAGDISWLISRERVEASERHGDEHR